MLSRRIAVVGTGITGLSAAYALKKNGADVSVFEKNSIPGGAIRTVRSGEWLTEYGPNTLLLKDKRVALFLDEIGLEDQIVEANPEASRRFIVKDGIPQPLPSTFAAAISTPLFSLQGKLNVLKEPFIRKSDDSSETVADFVERRLGREILEYAINPFVAGIFASNPEDLSLRHAFPVMYEMEQEYGSLILAAIFGGSKRRKMGRIPRRLISFRNGMQQLPAQIADHLDPVYYNTHIDTVERREKGWVVKSAGAAYGPFEAVILNIPFYQQKDILEPVDPKLKHFFDTVHYPPLSVVHLGYKKEDIEHPLDGFGFLVPAAEERGILGALFSSTLFPNRASGNHHLLTVFAGGGRQPEVAGLQTNQLVEMIESELSDLIGLNGSHLFMDHVFWPHAIPGYEPGYDSVLGEYDRLEREQPGLFIAGNFRNGISVPDCIQNGLRLAQKLSKA
ncbi:MAG: protoporphyrinogen oxidase [Balneolaceae bacterium]|nr:MAG: protoporphyrinogen oxidase [Balneolaceae bacterium]